MADPYVEQLDSEYRFLKSELEKEVNGFELLHRQHKRRANRLADDISRTWLQLQRAKQESRA